MDEEQLKQLMAQVNALRETVEAKFSPEKLKAEEDALFAKVKEMLHPQKRTMQWAISNKGDNPEAKKVFFTQFLKATLTHDKSFFESAGIKTVMSEGDDAQGGYTVPEEYSNEIIKLEREESIIRRMGRIFPMGTLTRRIPRQLTHVTPTWTDEAAVKTRTKPTFDRLTQIAKKLAAIVPLTDELREDNNVNLDNFVMQLVAESMGLEIDRVAFAGNTGVGDPFMGVLYAAGVNVVTMGGASVTFDDVANLIFAVGSPYRANGTFVTSSLGLQKLMVLKDADGRYLWSAPNGLVPAKIWNYPYEISDQIPVNLNPGANRTALLFGNFKKFFYVSDRGGYEVISSNSASDWIGGALESAFTQDETWHRFKRRLSLDVALPTAFSRLVFK